MINGKNNCKHLNESNNFNGLIVVKKENSYSFEDPDSSWTEITNIKFCPFCGDELK